MVVGGGWDTGKGTGRWWFNRVVKSEMEGKRIRSLDMVEDRSLGSNVIGDHLRA